MYLKCIIFLVASLTFGESQKLITGINVAQNSESPIVQNEVSEEIFYLYSRESSIPAPSGVNLRWTIRKTDWTVCSMTFIIKHLPRKSCDDVYLLVGNQKICGENFNAIAEFALKNNPYSKLEVTFHSSLSSGNGLKVLVIQHSHTCRGAIDLRPTADCDMTFNDVGGLFGVSKYLNNTLHPPMTDCKIVFPKPRSSNPYCGVKITFLKFDLGSNCKYDNLVFDGKTYCEQQLQKEERIIPFSQISTKGITITLNIRSEPFTNDGFIASYQRIKTNCPIACNKVFQTESFSMISPPVLNSMGIADCTYTAQKTSSKVKCIQVDVKKLELNNADDACTSNYLQLFNDKRVCKISQLETLSYKVPFPVRRSSLVTNFHRVTRGVNTGFEIAVKQLTTGCPPDTCQTISEPSLMTSTNYPNNYPRNLKCKFSIKRTENKPMNFTLNKINLRIAPGTQLLVPGGFSLLEMLKTRSQVTLSLMNNFALDFVSGDQVDSGFQFFFKPQIEVLQQCHSTVEGTTTQGEFLTPSYALGKYPEKTMCVMTIVKVANNCKVVLSIDEFAMAPRDPATGECKDYVDWSLDGKKCGTLTKEEFGNVVIPFGANQDKVFIKFNSDDNKADNLRGIKFLYKQSSTDC